MEDLDLSILLTGQAAQWRQFVDAAAPIVLGTVRRTFARYGRQSMPDEQEDISQEVFVKLARNDFQLLRKFDPTKAKLSTFVAVVSRSTTIDFLRRLKPPAEDVYALAEKIPAPDSALGLAGDPASSASQTLAKGVLGTLPTGLISPKQHAILAMLFDHDLDPEEIANQLGVETQTIRSAKHKALSKIRAFVANQPAHERLV